jgi:glycosyltransferase involved in cell wall biosynthesis
VKFWGWILVRIWSADILFTRFAHYQAFLLGIAAKLFHKKFAIVIGGSDAVWIPAYHYGVYDHWFSRRTTRWALRMADLLLPNHESLIRGVNTYSDPAPRPEGLLEYTPDLKTRIVTIHNGYDSDYWHPVEGVARERLVLEVAIATEYRVYVTKGLEEFIQTAARTPEFSFILVGVSIQNLSRWRSDPLPPNLTLRPPLAVEELRVLYSRAAVFAHFTLTEGMPNVLCEAMLCGCVPVGSHVNSLPDIIGHTGLLVSKRDPEEMSAKIRAALSMGTGPDARRRIIERYPLQKREHELQSVILELASS